MFTTETLSEVAGVPKEALQGQDESAAKKLADQLKRKIDESYSEEAKASVIIR